MSKPKIRFKGYEEDWEQRKFGDLYEKVSRKNDLTYGKNDIISVANMYYKEDAVVKNTEYLKTYNIFELGDIAFEGNKSKNFAHGRFVENTIGNGIVSHVFDVFKPIAEYDLMFWKYMINNENIMGKIMTRCTKSSTMMTNLVAKDFLKESILVPNLNEQHEIGLYLKSIDHLITLHQRKCEETKKLKKYMLQKMFPQNGKRVPEIRFAGFTDDWEQRKLDDVLKRRIEQRQQSEEYPRLAFASGQGVIPLSERKTNNREQLTKDEYTKKYLVTELNDIVYNPANVKYGAIDRNKCGRGLISPIYVTFTTNEVPGFIERIVTSHDFQQRALRFEEGTVTKRQSVNPEDLVTLDILVAPKREEQQKIATYFDSLDHLITLHQRKCEELQKIKKFMLQNMFV